MKTASRGRKRKMFYLQLVHRVGRSTVTAMHKSQAPHTQNSGHSRPGENLTAAGRVNLSKLLAANKRLNMAYLLKESFSQLWDYEREAWARRFFDNWCASLKWQRL